MSSLPQGVSAFQYASETKSSGLTGYAGLGVYLDLAEVGGLWGSVERHVGVRRVGQGWPDGQMVRALVLLNLAGEPAQDAPRPAGRAWIPAPNPALWGFGRVQQDQLAFVQRQAPQRVATMDQAFRAGSNSPWAAP